MPRRTHFSAFVVWIARRSRFCCLRKWTKPRSTWQGSLWLEPQTQAALHIASKGLLLRPGQLYVGHCFFKSLSRVDNVVEIDLVELEKRSKTAKTRPCELGRLKWVHNGRFAGVAEWTRLIGDGA